jgi:hypothetical protein
MSFPVDWTHHIANDYRARTRSLESRKGNVFLIIHHAYNYNVYQTIDTFESPVRTVSANFAIGPKRSSDTENIYVVRTVAEHLRAYTTASSLDDQALTVETSNINLNDPYPVAQKAKRKLAELAAYMHTEYGMPLDRWHVTSHQEVYKRGLGSYATACPGGDLQGALDWIVDEAKRIVAGGTNTQEIEVIHYHNEDRRARFLEPGNVTQLKLADGSDVNVTRAIGDYSITTHVGVTGTPGDEFEVVLLWYPKGFANGNPSEHYTARHVIGPNVAEEGSPEPVGVANVHDEFKRAVVSGNAVSLRVRAPQTNSNAIRVTMIDCDAYAFNVQGS